MPVPMPSQGPVPVSASAPSTYMVSMPASSGTLPGSASLAQAVAVAYPSASQPQSVPQGLATVPVHAVH